MAISKPENSTQSTERDDEIERERAGHTGEFENGYGYGYDGERDESAREEHARQEEARQAEVGAFEPAGSEEESRATTLSAAEPGATIGHGATNRDENYRDDETERDGSYRDRGYGDDDDDETERGGALDQESATDRGDEDLNRDSMTGDAVQTQPQSTPMQPAAVPEFASATTPIASSQETSAQDASTQDTLSEDTSAQDTSSPVTPTAQSPLATDPGPVLAPEASLDFRERWHGIQAEFIDDPRRAVEDADRLVADVARAFTSSVEERRQGLTSGWRNDEHGETEQLRLTMRQYRALVDHILHD